MLSVVTIYNWTATAAVVFKVKGMVHTNALRVWHFRPYVRPAFPPFPTLLPPCSCNHAKC